MICCMDILKRMFRTLTEWLVGWLVGWLVSRYAVGSTVCDSAGGVQEVYGGAHRVSEHHASEPFKE